VTHIDLDLSYPQRLRSSSDLVFETWL
jgi:hypothetical protein